MRRTQDNPTPFRVCRRFSLDPDGPDEAQQFACDRRHDLPLIKPPMQLADVLLGVGLVLCIRDPVDPDTGILSQTPKCY